MTIILDDNAVARLLDPLTLVEAIERAIVEEPKQPSAIPERMNLAGGGRFLRLMPAVIPNSGVMGLKTFFGGGGVGVRYLIMLASIETGETLALLDACHLTAARTAATSVIGARAMNARSQVLGVLGSGLEAEVHIRTFVALGGVEQVRIFSPNPKNRDALASRIQDDLGVEAVSCDSPSDVCDGVTHLITATNTGYGGPVACADSDIPSGIHLTAIGSTHEDLRELEPEVFMRAKALVFDADASQIGRESGDIKCFVDAGGALDQVILLDEVLQGRAKVEVSSDDLTIFKSVGTALQDLVAANIAYEQAVATGVGLSVPAVAQPKVRR